MKILLLAIAVVAVGLAVLAVVVAQPVLPRRGRARVQLASPARLRADVEKLAVEFSPRDWREPENLRRAADYIAAEFGRAGARVRLQRFRSGRHEYMNVIGEFGPEAGELVIVGAHYDAWGGLPGADDNASGVAGVIELARLLGERQLSGPVHLLAYALEEPPHFRGPEMGSMVHAKSLRDGKARVKAMIGLEMIGYFSDAPGSQGYPLDQLKLIYPDEGNFIVVAGRVEDTMLVRRVKKAMAAASDLPVHSINAPREIAGIDFSDHASYWEYGLPAVMITDSAFYRNPNYHTEADMPDTLDYKRLAKVVDQVLGATIDLALNK